MARFHHIVNRGVAKHKVYRCSEDKEKFLENKGSNTFQGIKIKG
jgi:hypothetical protein